MQFLKMFTLLLRYIYVQSSFFTFNNLIFLMNGVRNHSNNPEK